MLKRFRKESGQLDAKRINWKLSDKSRLPSQYQGIVIDSDSMSRAKYFENPDIVDNIHFKPCTKDRPNLKKRKTNACIDDDNSEVESENDLREDIKVMIKERDPRNIVLLKIRRRLLEIFRTDSDRPNAEKVIWDKIDSDRLPEKYKNTLLTFRTVYGQKLYEDPEFMENVHFKPYYKKKSKN
jgi:hypothetical protein